MESENIIRALWAVCIDISQGAIMRGLVYLLSCKSSAFTRQPGLVAGVQWRAEGGHPAAELETFPFKDPALCCPAQPSPASPAQPSPAQPSLCRQLQSRRAADIWRLAAAAAGAQTLQCNLTNISRWQQQLGGAHSGHPHCGNQATDWVHG